MAEQYGFSKPPKQYTGILIQQIPGSSYSILQYTANPVSNHRPMIHSSVVDIPKPQSSAYTTPSLCFLVLGSISMMQ